MESGKLPKRVNLLHLPLEEVFKEVFEIKDTDSKEIIGLLQFLKLLAKLILILAIIGNLLGVLFPYGLVAIGFTTIAIKSMIFESAKYFPIDLLFITGIILSWGIVIASCIIMHGLRKILMGAIKAFEQEHQLTREK